MTLRTRLALVLVALVIAPLVAAGVLVLYAVPRAAADRADGLVTGARASINDELAQQCDRVATAAVVAGRMLGSETPSAATRTAVEDGLADWVSVVTNRGNTIASAGAMPQDVVASPWPDCRAGESGGPALTSEQRVVISEPFGDLPGAWHEVPESSVLIIQPGPDVQREFKPRALSAV